MPCSRLTGAPSQVEIVLLLDGKQEQEIEASAAAARMTKTYCTAFYVDPARAPGEAHCALCTAPSGHHTSLAPLQPGMLVQRGTGCA